MLTEQQEKELLENVKTFTDHKKYVDAIFKSARLGKDMVVAFQCGHSGMLYPADYLKEWGKKYGIGLGPEPVSECLDSEYDSAPALMTSEIKSFEQIAHGVVVTKAQLDHVLVSVDAFDSLQLITALADPFGEKRMKIVRVNQLKNPKSRLPEMALLYNQMRKGMVA